MLTGSTYNWGYIHETDFTRRHVSISYGEQHIFWQKRLNLSEKFNSWNSTSNRWALKYVTWHCIFFFKFWVKNAFSQCLSLHTDGFCHWSTLSKVSAIATSYWCWFSCIVSTSAFAVPIKSFFLNYVSSSCFHYGSMHLIRLLKHAQVFLP